jgi:hypothetical protein
MDKMKTVDAEKDFDQPVKKQPEQASEEAVVRDGFALVTFLKPHFDRDKDDHAFVSYEMSLPLTEEHAKWVPEEIAEAWEVVSDHGYKVGEIRIENQRAEILLAPKVKEGSLIVDTAEIESAMISTVVESGSGEDKEVIRLKFRVRMELDNDAGRFARVHFGHPVWLKLEPLQRKLIK